jgi:hypothetical protein
LRAEASATARPRGAIIPVRSFVVTKASDVPSGENCGDTFMPARSTMGRMVPAAASTAKILDEYGARKPTNGANAYAISRPFGAHEKLSTY